MESLKSIDPALYEKFLVMNDFMFASNELATSKNDKTKWNNYIAKAKLAVPLDDSEPMSINNICWNIYENYLKYNDIEALKLAKEWEEKAHNALPNNHPINDTYAHILFDLGFVKEVIEHEELAIKVATEEKSDKDLKFYNDEIERFRKAK